MKVTAVQLNTSTVPFAESVREALARALHDGVRILLFPLYDGPLSASEISPSLEDLQETARLGRMMICISRSSLRSILIDTDGAILGEVGSDLEGRVFKTTLGRVGVACTRGGKFFTVAENMVENGARLILHPMSALTGMSFEAIDQMRSEHSAQWKYALVAANFVGEVSGGEKYAGCSLVALPSGEIPAKASFDAPDFVSVELPADALTRESILEDRFRLLPKFRRIAEITRFTPPIL